MTAASRAPLRMLILDEDTAFRQQLCTQMERDGRFVLIGDVACGSAFP
jgi:ActR/RegA family two-component response regulator